MQGAKFVKIAVLTEKIRIFPVKFQNSREKNGVFLDWAKSVGAQQKMAQMYDFSRFVKNAKKRHGYFRAAGGSIRIGQISVLIGPCANCKRCRLASGEAGLEGQFHLIAVLQFEIVENQTGEPNGIILLVAILFFHMAFLK